MIASDPADLPVLAVTSSRGCGCSAPAEGVPVLDARLLPHAVRHAAVLGAFDAVPPGGALDLVTPHRPVPLLREIAARLGGDVTVEDQERTEGLWRGRVRRSAPPGP